MISDKLPDALPQAAPPSGAWRDGWRLAAWCLVCLGAPLVVLPGDDPLTGNAGDDQPLGWQQKHRVDPDRLDMAGAVAELRAEQPDYIGIGNSMLYTRLGKTPEAISALTGRKFHLIWKGGSNVPEWFLILKNVVAFSGVRPKAIFFFVRDDDMTRPYARKGGESAYLRNLRGREEPELDQFMYRARSDALNWLDRSYAFPEWKERISRRVTDVALDLGGGGMPKNSQRYALSVRFGLEHLRGDLGADIPVEGEDDAADHLPQNGKLDLEADSVADMIKASLLPEMLRIAESCGAKLIVFRVKRRPDATTHLPFEPQAIRMYSDALGLWLKRHGAVYYDETYDTSIRLTDYLDGDHIRPERLDWYRGYFWERMRGVFP